MVKSSNDLIDDFTFAYATSLEKIFNYHLHDEDSNCDWCYTGQRKVSDYGKILTIYQPKNSDGWVEEAAFIFTLSKEAKSAGYKLTEQSLKTFENAILSVNTKLYESFYNFVKDRDFMWYETLPTTVFLNYNDFAYTLCDMTKPLTYDNGVLKFSFKPKYLYMEFDINGWNPLELINYRKTLPSYVKYAESHKKKYMEDLDKSFGSDSYAMYVGYTSQDYLVRVIDQYIEDEDEGDRKKYLAERGRLVVPNFIGLDNSSISSDPSKPISGKKRKHKEIS